MARFSAKHSLFLPSLMLAVLFLCSAVSFSSARTVQVADICSKHKNSANCAYILNSVPGVAAGADLDSLSLYIINLAHVNAFDTLTLIHDLVQNTTDPQLRLRYSPCTMDYTDVLLCLSQAQQSYTTEDYNAMNSKGATVIKDLQDCDSKAPTDPSPLMKNNQDLEDVSMIIMILADFLAGKY